MIKDYLVNVRTIDDKLPMATRITLDGVEVWNSQTQEESGTSENLLPPPPPPPAAEVAAAAIARDNNSDNSEYIYPDKDNFEGENIMNSSLGRTSSKKPSIFSSDSQRMVGRGRKNSRTAKKRGGKVRHIKTKSRR